ncbi:MAG TPA: hypothetical protein VLM85_09980 [Polyangiaceae bacterium]|nr:hypothetical protein [Polyangiaceae bacterium]
MKRGWFAIVSSSILGCAYGLPIGEAPPPADDASAPSTNLASRGPRGIAPVDLSVRDAAPTDAAEASVEAGPDAGGSMWSSPACDGVVTAAEYGGANNEMPTPTGQTWRVTWDANALYVAVEGANVEEALVLYVGYSGAGLSAGEAYDGTDVAKLSFLADAVVYAKASYDEARTVTGSAWAKTGTVTVCASASNATIREVAIPWTSLGASGLPPSFRWMGYLTSATGYVYGQLPGSNPGMLVGLSATFTHDYFVQSTSNGSGAFPFGDEE